MAYSRRKALITFAVGSAVLSMSGVLSAMENRSNLKLGSSGEPGQPEEGNALKGYWLIFASDITNEAAQKEYLRLWKPVAKKYGAVLKSIDNGALRESSGARRVIVVEFPSYSMASACYEDPSYLHAKEFAIKASKRELLIIEGSLA